nr:protein Aster-A isoform X7 [Chrysemys picta bellii]
MFDTGSPSPRSSPSSSPSLRKRLLLPPRTSPELPADAMVEKSTESVPERGPLSAPLNYPLSARSFIRNNKKAQSWYSMLSPTYKQRNEDFRRIFKGLPESERLLVDYSCALQRDILLQGRLYLSENWLCFYSNIFRWETAISVPLREVKCLKKEKMAKLIPNAIQVCTAADKDEAEVDAFSDLPGRLLLNCVYCLGAERLQQMLFSDSPFMQSFLGQRKFTDVTLTSWSGKSKCHQSRVLSYTIPLSNPLGPKAAAVVETQTLFRASPDSGACVVDSEVITQGIPYQDYFYTAHRYCISTLATGTARLRVSSEIRYRKQPWNLVRALIEKNTWSGVEEYFQHLGLALARAEKTLLEESGHGIEPRGLLAGLRRRKRTLGWRAPHAEPTLATLPPSETGPRTLRPSSSLAARLSQQLMERSRGPTVSTLILIVSLVICVSLLVLVVLNVMLLYRLWALEHTARAFQAWQASALARGKLPRTAGEWAEVLELQRRFHGAEVQKWRRILEASVELLDEMKVSLEKLHQGIMMAEPPPEPGQADTIS